MYFFTCLLINMKNFTHHFSCMKVEVVSIRILFRMLDIYLNCHTLTYTHSYISNSHTNELYISTNNNINIKSILLFVRIRQALRFTFIILFYQQNDSLSAYSTIKHQIFLEYQPCTSYYITCLHGTCTGGNDE